MEVSHMMTKMYRIPEPAMMSCFTIELRGRRWRNAEQHDTASLGYVAGWAEHHR